MMDYQRGKVYAWEEYLETGKNIPFDDIQKYVNAVWENSGLKYPPLVAKMPKNRTKAIADATRFKIRFHGDCCERIILHEIAHSMTASVDDKSHQHNDVFVGVYMGLMERFMGLSANMLEQSATMCGVKFNQNKKPRILDGFGIY